MQISAVWKTPKLLPHSGKVVERILVERLRHELQQSSGDSEV
jgi:hypothetical protein